MKKILTALVFTICKLSFSQVIIGDNVGTATDKTSVLLEFSSTQNKGIILPYITDKTGLNTPGSMILNATTPTAAKVEYYNGTTWVDLSGQAGDVTTALATQPPTSVSETDAKAIIGATSSTADGVLVLESNTKAMVLPTVADVQNIPSPSPGMMVYVAGVSPTFYKRLAVFNGSRWSFWKP